jgi:hypothetical protein
MDTQRWRKYPRKYNHKPTDQYCGGIQFDTSQMDDLEFERLLLWSYKFPQHFTQRHDAELTAEVYRRAEQVRAKREREAVKAAFEMPVVRVSEIGRLV